MALLEVFDVYRSGYALGQQHARAGERRRAGWELQLTRPLVWVPLVSTASFLEGYEQGYHDEAAVRGLVNQWQQP